LSEPWARNSRASIDFTLPFIPSHGRARLGIKGGNNRFPLRLRRVIWLSIAEGEEKWE